MKKYSLFLIVQLSLLTSMICAQNLKTVQINKPIKASATPQIKISDSTKATSMVYGYCGDLGNALSAGVNKEHKAAIRISEETARKLQGNTLSDILIAIGNKGTKPSIFLTYDLSEEPFYMQTTTLNEQSWNTVSLTTPYLIEGKEFYIGYTITSSSIPQQSYVLGIDQEKNEGNGGYIAVEGNNQWMNLADEGFNNLCIKAKFEGESLPQYDLALTATKLPAKVQMNQPFSFKAVVKNTAAHPVSSFNLSYTINAGQTVTISVTPEKEIGSDQSLELTVSDVSTTELGSLPITITVSDPNGQIDEDLNNNTINKQIKSIENSVIRKILLENFTTAQCGNCPSAHTEIAKALKGRDDVIWVCHHTGFGTDNFTIDASKQYLWFFNDNSTYAPAIMLDRTNMTEDPGPVTGVKNAEIMKMMLDERKEDLASISVNIQKEYNESTRVLTVTISGQSMNPEITESIPNLNIFLTENDLIGRQAGAAANYVHNHVIRATITDYWGENITFNENSYSQTHTITLKNGWKAENMDIVAFISNYDSEDPNNCMILNAEITPVTKKDANGIESMTEADDVSIYTLGSTVYISGNYQKAIIYDISGRVVATIKETDQFNLINNGIYIIKVIGDREIYSKKLAIGK